MGKVKRQTLQITRAAAQYLFQKLSQEKRINGWFGIVEEADKERDSLLRRLSNMLKGGR